MTHLKKHPSFMFLAALALCAGTVHAQTTIFSESFGGTAGNLNGTTTDVGGFTWTAPTSMTLDGSGNLSITPNSIQYGFVKVADVASVGVYTLAIDQSVAFSAGVNGNFAMGAGFTSSATTTTNIREGIALLENAQDRAMAYLETANVFYSANNDVTVGSATLTIELDTTAGLGAIWDITYKYTDAVNGTVTLGTTTLDSSTLGGDGLYVGVGAIHTISGTVQDMELTFVPEPGAYAMLAGLIGFAFVALRRRAAS